MRTGWDGCRVRLAGAAKIAVLCGSIALSACASGPGGWLDHTALVLRPSHHQAIVAYSFGGGGAVEEPRDELRRNATRSVAASLAAAMVVDDNPLPTIDTMDFKGGRVYIHAPRQRQPTLSPLLKP